jgi:Trk K+ transport system NAD-binding subunit
MIAGKRFVICGLSRLTTRVARILAARGAEVVIVRGAEGDELVELVEGEARVIRMSGDREGALRAAGVAEAACLLALAEEDMVTLRGH